MVSVGGGAVLDPGDRVALRAGGTVVWLRARPETLARRVGRTAPTGPCWPGPRGGTDGGAVPASTRSAGRSTRRWPTRSIDVDDLTAAAVAERVLATVASHEVGPTEHP